MMEEYDIEEGHAKVPRWLIWSYLILPIWGFVWLFLYWNGSVGYLDPNYWQQLERAANTTYPIQDLTYPKRGEETTKRSNLID